MVTILLLGFLGTEDATAQFSLEQGVEASLMDVFRAKFFTTITYASLYCHEWFSYPAAMSSICVGGDPSVFYFWDFL